MKQLFTIAFTIAFTMLFTDARAQEPVVIPAEIVAKCQAGGGCVIVLEADLKAALEKAKQIGAQACRKTI